MKKFAANYLISGNGIFLKNGIVIANDDGTVVQYLDPEGDLKEMAGLSFHNGILIAGYVFRKSTASIHEPGSQTPLRILIEETVDGKTEFSLQNLIDLGKKIQEQYTEMKIPEILNEISDVLQSVAGLVKQNIPGIYLLIGVDLPQLHFTSRTRIKRML